MSASRKITIEFGGADYLRPIDTVLIFHFPNRNFFFGYPINFHRPVVNVAKYRLSSSPALIGFQKNYRVYHHFGLRSTRERQSLAFPQKLSQKVQGTHCTHTACERVATSTGFRKIRLGELFDLKKIVSVFYTNSTRPNSGGGGDRLRGLV